MAKKKRKAGSIAIPFLFTFFVAFLILGGAGLFIYNYFGLNKDSEPEDLYVTDYDTVTYKDSHTILLVLDIPEQKCSTTFVVMRSVPKEKKILFTGIPTNTITLVDGKQEKLQDVYTNEGIVSAEKFISNLLGIEIKKYMKFNSDAFLKVSDIMGGVSYGVTADIIGFQNTDKEQYLNGQQTITLMTYSLFKGGESERASMAASVLSAMLNQSDGKMLADGFDRNFATIIDMIDTNISSVDYKKKEYAIKFMLNYGTSISHFSMITGTTSSNNFIMDQGYSKDIVDEYFTDHTKDKKKSSKSSKESKASSSSKASDSSSLAESEISTKDSSVLTESTSIDTSATSVSD